MMCKGNICHISFLDDVSFLSCFSFPLGIICCWFVPAILIFFGLFVLHQVSFLSDPSCQISLSWNEQPANSISFLLSSTVLRLGMVQPSVFQLWMAGTNECYSLLLVDQGDGSSGSTLTFPFVSSFDNLFSCHQLSRWDREQKEKRLFWGGQEPLAIIKM